MHFVKSSRCGSYLHSASCFIPLNTWNCKAEVALSQLTVCIGVCIIKLIKLLFASFHLLAILGNDSGNEPQDISEVHPSIKGGDIWPKMISMKQQDPLESHDWPYLRMQFRFAVLSSTFVRFPNVETEVGNVLLCKSSLVPCFFGML